MTDTSLPNSAETAELVGSVAGEVSNGAASGRKAQSYERDWLAFSAILLIGAVLRFYQLGAPSLWNDEIFSWYFQKQGLHFLWSEGLVLEPTPPLYYGLLALWTSLAGDSEAGLRSLSVIASLLTIFVVWRVGRELFTDRRHGWLAALIFALAPTSIYYAQEARTYALVGLSLAAAMWGQARFLRADASVKALAGYVVAAALALYFHITAVLFVVGANIVMLAGLLTADGMVTKRHFRRWVIANAILFVLALPLGVVIASPTVAQDIAHMDPLSPHLALFSLAQTLTGREVPGRYAGYAISLIFSASLVSALLAPSLWRQKRAMGMLLILPLSFVLLAVLLSLRQPVLVPRVLSWLWIPLSLLVAHCLIEGARRIWLAAAIFLLFAVGITHHILWRGWNNDDWRGVLARVEPDLRRADVVVLGKETLAPGLGYYAPDARPAYRGVRVLAGPGWTTVMNSFIPKRLGLPTIAGRELAAILAAGQHVTLIARGEDIPVLDAWESRLPPPRSRFDSVCGGDICFRVLVW